MRKKILLMTFLVAIIGFCGTGLTAQNNNVAKVGNTEYATIDDAIAAWTNNTTLTLLSDVTLSDVVTLSSQEHHYLALGTYTMTAASSKNAIEIKSYGRSNRSESGALTITADATTPGGINAGSKACIYYKYDATLANNQYDRPIIYIKGGVFTGSSYSGISSNGHTSSQDKCATFNISGGIFNCGVNLTKTKLSTSGGTFNGSLSCTGGSTSTRLISGGTFKSFGFMTADSNNTKFWIGTSMGNSNVGAYIDDNGYLVVGGPVVTEPGTNFEASSPNHSNAGFGSYLTYSSVATNGIYYTSVEEALTDNNKANGSVTVYVDELNMADFSSYKGTIVVPENSTITITNAPEGLKVTDEEGNALTSSENGEYTTIVPVEVATYDGLVAALANGGVIKLTADITVDTKITAIDGTVIDLNDNTLYVNVENSYYNNVTIKNGNIVLGKDDVHVCDGYFLVNEGKTLELNDVNVSSSEAGIKGFAVFHLKTGANLDLINSTLNIADNEYTAGYIVYAGEETATVDVVGTTITGSKVNGIVHATTVIDESTVTLTNVIEHGINRSGVTIDDSNVTISGGTGRGITAQHGPLNITGNSVVSISEMGEATIELRNNQNLTVAETATVTVDADVNNTTSGTITGNVIVDASVGKVAKVGDTYYKTLQEAIDACEGENNLITLLNNITFESDLNNAGKGYFNIADGKKVVLDMNGKIINVTDKSTGNFIVFYNYGEFTIANGTINLNSTNNREWNAESAIFLNRGGIFNIENGIYTHNGGTDMAFVVDNSGNYYGDATTNIYEKTLQRNNVTTELTSSYIAIRNRMEQNSHGASGKAILNVEGGDISGTSRAIWAQAASTSETAPATGEINVKGGNIGLIDTPRSTGAVSMTTISGGEVSAFKGEAGELTVTGGTLNEVTLLTAAGETVDDYVVNEDGLYVQAVAKIGETSYETLQAAVDAVQNGQTITLLADAAEDVTIPAGVTFNGNGKAVGNIIAAGTITFNGHTKATSFSVENTNTTINIVEGACLEITGTGRMVIGHGCTFNITGSIEDAKTADKADLTPSLIMPGASFTGAGVTFNVTNAYISAPSSYCSSKNSASGTFDFNITNSIWDSAGKLAFEAQSTAAKVDFALVNSVLTTGSHLVFATASGEEGVVIDNSLVNQGTSRQIENLSTMTIKNGSVVNGAVATSSNAKNPGTIIVENATYAVTGEFSGSDLGTGTLIIKKGATVSAGSITKANITIDATGMTAGEEVNLTADLSQFTGTLSVINNDKLEASIVDGKIVLAVKPVAQIGDVEYATLKGAIAEVEEGQTIEFLAGTIEEGTIKLPATLKNVTFKGAADNTSILKDMTIMASDGNSFSYIGLTFDGIQFDNSRIVFTGWRNGEETIEDLTITNCIVKNLYDDTNMAFLHINKGASEPVKNLTFTNNVLDGVTGGSKSGIYSVNTGKVIIKGNTFNNIVFRPALVQLSDCDGIVDNVEISNNEISNTTRLQVYGTEVDNGDGTYTPTGTDELAVKINNNIFKNISGYYICTWGINGDYDISKNYYDSDNLSEKIYWNNEKPSTVNGLYELGVYPVYTELNADGTINTESEYTPNIPFAQIGETGYPSLEAAAAAAQAGDEILLLANVTLSEELTTTADITLNGNGKQINGTINAGGALTIKGQTKVTKFGAGSGNTITIGAGACLEMNGTDRMVIGHGCTFNITGTITDAKTANVADLTPSLIMPGASFTGAGVTFNVTNAYIKAPSSYCSSSKSASGTFVFKFDNSIWESAGKLAFESQSTAATVNFELKDSKLTTGSHLVFGVSRGEVVFDNSHVNVGTSRQIENQSTMTVKNGSVVNGAVATSSNAKNPGTLIVDNATYAVTGEFSGSDLGTGTLIVKKGATVSAGSITKANIQIDATGMTIGDEINLTANLANLAGTLEVINNDNLDAEIIDGKIVLVKKTVAMIGDVKYSSLQEAFKAATSGCTIEILSNVTIDEAWDCRNTGSKFTVPVTINGNDNTIKFTGAIDDKNWNTVFRFEEEATVNNLTVNIEGATTVQRVITAKKSLNVDDLIIVGSSKYGIIFGEGASAEDLAATEIVIKNSALNGTRRAVSDNEGGKDVKSVVIDGNNLKANVYVSASERIVFNDNTTTSEVDLRSYAADNILSVEAKDNELNEEVKNYIYAKNIDAQEEFTTENPPLKVANKAELNAAIAAAKEGNVITLTADIDYGTDQLKIEKAITLDLGGKTLTTRNGWGGMSIKNNPTVKNGTIVHASTTAAIKVWNATAFEDLVIDVQGKGDANKTIGGIVLQSGSTTKVGSIKNVTIKGAALTNGIETYNCGDATENVIGSMENVNIDAVGTAMLISAPCGTATNCTFDGGVNGIEIWIKGNYSASLGLVDCDVVGGVFAHDEFSSNPEIVNNGTLNLTADETTTGAGVDDVTLEIARAEAEKVQGVLKDVMVNAKAKLNNVYYATLAEAIAAAEAGETVTLLQDVTLADALVIEEGMDVTVSGEGKTITGCDGKDVFYVKGGKLTLTEGLNVHAPTDCAIYLRGGDVFTAANLTKSGDKYSVIQGNGNYAGNVTITGGKVKASDKLTAIYWPQNGKLTITGGEITGHSAVYIASGSLEITGGKLHGVGANGSYEGVTGGSANAPGEALTIENVGGNSGYEEISSVVISGGEFISDNAKAVGSYANTTQNPEAKPVAGFISGGTFVNPVAPEFCAAGFMPNKNADGTYGVVVDPAYGKVAKVGDVYYETLAEAVAAAESGATITLLNGEHELPLFANKELTFVGESKEGVIVNDAPTAVTQGWNGSTFHFENLTAKGATANYHGLANGVKAVTYKNCNINGLRFLYATEGVSFEGCAFNANGVEHSFWTYGASNVTVKNSTFTYTDRAVNCYSENGANHEADITFEGCSFTYAGTNDTPEGAVEINSGSAKSFDIAFTGCTAPEKGAMWFNSQWDNKNGENTVVKVDDVIVWQVVKVAKIGDVEYTTLEAAFAAATEGQTITLLADVTLAGGYEDATEGLRIEKEITLNGNGYTINCGNFQKGIRIYNPSNVSDFNVNFNNVEVVNNVANGRCIDTRSGNINLKVNSSTLIATNGNSQPLTIGGNDPVHRVTLNETTIDAGASGYAVISFVSTNVDIQGVNNSTISGFAAFYLKGDAKTTNLNLGQGVYTGTNNHAIESGVFGTVVLEGDNNVVNLMGTNATVKAIANNTAPQAAFLVRGANNTIKITKESAKIITEGNAYEAMVKADNAATTKFVDMGIERKLVAENEDYQFYSFEEAVRFAGNEGTIKVVNDFELAEAWTVAAGQNITLDLNGKTISQTKECTASYEMICNKGNLTITDSSDAKDGKLSFKDTSAGDPSFGWGSYTVRNEGNLVVENGTIEHLGEQAFAKHCIMAIYQYCGSTTINGGTISTPNYRSARLWKGEMTINGGTFDGQVWVQAVDNTAKLTVNGGTFAPNGNDASAVFVTNSQYDVQFAVTDGTFNGKVGCSDATKLANAITGGKFNAAAVAGTSKDLIAFGYEFGAADADGYQTVYNDESVLYIETLADLKAFRDAVNNGTNYYAGVNVYLAADIDMAGENWVGIGTATKDHGFMGNFDGQGYKIKNLTITDPALDSDGYAYAGFFGVTEGTDKDNQNTIKNLTIENVTISTTGNIAAAAIAYPYYTIIDNVKVCGDIKIQGGDYTAGVLAYTRRCVNASNLSIVGNEGSFVKGKQTVGGVISDIQMNGGLTAVYNNFSAEGLTISGTKQVGGISGIIATQTLVGASVKNVALNCSDARVGIVSGSLGGPSTISDVTYENVTGATNLIGATYDGAKAVAAKIGDTYYATLEAALAAQGEATVELLAPVTVATGETRVLNLNGKTVVATDNATGSYAMITNKGDLTINGEGAIRLTATNNRGWNAYSSVISNTVGGKLTVNGGTIEHLGGTDMAYGIDNLTNGKGTYAETVINGGYIKSTYRAIRQFLNGVEAQNILTVNGGTIEGANKSIWMQDPSKNANTGTLAVGENAQLKGDVYLYVTAGSTSWPVEVSIADAALQGESTVMTGNVPAGYELELSNGIYCVTYVVATIGDNRYETLQAAITAAGTAETTINVIANTTENITIQEGANITLEFDEDITLNGYFAPFKGNLTINDGTINNTNSGASAIEINAGELNLNNVNIASARHAVRIDGTVTATIDGGEYTLTATSGTRHAVNVSGVAEVTIIAGTFVGPKGTTMDSGSAVCVRAGAKVTIEGGDFSKGKNATLGVTGTMIVTGGTFDQDPSAYLAQGYITKYNETTSRYEVFKGVAKIENEYFASIQDAIDAAENNDVITVISDFEMDITSGVTNSSGHYVLTNVANKAVVIDLNGKKVTVDVTNLPEGCKDNMLMSVFCADTDGNLTLKDSSNGNGSVSVTGGESKTVYSLVIAYGGLVNIEGGNYSVDYMPAGRGMIYGNVSDHSGADGSNVSKGVNISGGNFTLGNVGTLANGSPWILATAGSNTGKYIFVTGGTYNADILHQHWIFEVVAPTNKALKNNGNGTYTIVDAVAFVKHHEYDGYYSEIGYATLEEAFEIAETGDVVTLVTNVELENTITVNAGKEIILDLNGKTISGVCNSGQGHMFMVQNTADLTVKDSSENEEGKITYSRGTSNTGWVIDLEGDLILESGTIELTGDSWSIGYAVDVRPNSWGSEYTEATTFTMSGGKLVSSDAAVRVASSSADNHENVSANFIMNGGEIEAVWDGIFVQQSNAAYDILNVRINGGNIKSALSPLRLYGPAATSVLNNVENPITLNITGGTFDYTGNDLGNEKWLVRGVIMVSGGATFEQMLEYTDFEITGGTFEGDVNAYCAEGFAATNNDNGTWTVMPAQKQSLVKGWNWYSSYIDINGVQGLEKIENALGTNGIQILGHEGFIYYDSEKGWYGPLVQTGLDVKKMYKIEVGEGGVAMRIAGNIVDFTNETIEIKNGFNWISYPFNQPMNLNDALSGFTPADGDFIISHFNFAFYYDNQWQGSLESFTPGEGYIYERIDVDTELSYNVSNTRGAVKANVTTDGNKWMPNGRLYPNNMTMIAVVDGLANANYEVAAFVNGELRGSARPIYIESLDAYMLFLTIHGGDEVEEMSFRLYDIDNDTEYDLSDRINYSNNAHLGSVREPYVFSRGTTGIGEASMSEVNIYPNPTTTGTEINLGATCDKVEVFNALGVKVAEYQNVDTIDALETAGIYVIRITNNGNVQNCRLVVK